jgi:hypothetical protein
MRDLSDHRRFDARYFPARIVGATSRSEQLDRVFIAVVSTEADLIWKVIRLTPPGVSLASRILLATVAGSPRRHLQGHTSRQTLDAMELTNPVQGRIVDTTYAQPGKNASLATPISIVFLSLTFVWLRPRCWRSQNARTYTSSIPRHSSRLCPEGRH